MAGSRSNLACRPLQAAAADSSMPFVLQLATQITVGGVAAYPFSDGDRARVERGNALDLLPSLAHRLYGASTSVT